MDISIKAAMDSENTAHLCNEMVIQIEFGVSLATICSGFRPS